MYRIAGHFIGIGLVAGLCMGGAGNILAGDLAVPPVEADAETAAESGPVDRSKPTEVIINYQQPATAEIAPQKAEPIPLLPLIKSGDVPAASKKRAVTRKSVKTYRKKKRRAKRTRTTTAQSHQAWWDRTGNLAVLAFRDCLAQFAAQHGVPQTPDGPRLAISRAMDEDCREPFDDMAGKIAGRMGAERFNTLSGELLTDVFIPAVTAGRGGGQQAKAVSGG